MPRDEFPDPDHSTNRDHEPERRGGDPASFRANRGRIAEAPRSWLDRAAGGVGPETRPRRRRGSSDRVLWTVITERLEAERRLDLSAVGLIVEDAEVTLYGTVRRKADKRRIEDVADIDGVRHVQNNLRVREPEGWAFI
jgi:hypothetical protein